MSEKHVPDLPPAANDLREHIDAAEAAPLEAETVSAIQMWRKACEIRSITDPAALTRALTGLSVKEIGALVAITADSLPVVQAAANWMTVRHVRRDHPGAVFGAEMALEIVVQPMLDRTTRELIRRSAS